MRARLQAIFDLLAAHFGPLHWWPAETPFEVAVGAILTQNTALTNVEMALANLHEAGAVSAAGIHGLERGELEGLIRPAGFFRQKAERLQLMTAHLYGRHGGRLETLLAAPLGEARAELLGLKGVGPETADSILLYAGGHPSFVVDAYTRRLFGRLGLLDGDEGYEAVRSLFMDRLPRDADLFNEYHALIVEECKIFCRKRSPLCPACPLLPICPFGRETR
ncbi:MAG: endonuclease [Desulfuromonas sp.]|uniref:endonuclease III domain-containing protein n=1 Tax=Desulfuromonas sp. TaxID=892 RepID=UPI000CC4E3E2|nr:endonuclease III domain-containing protein [Desulfuromonas sp.]PLX84913.1 MAG: endonuclease [Desulfuromonas sp.]